MTYKEALEFIHARKRFGSVLGLERISTLLEYLGNPHKKLKYVHVAGTDGKGSTCYMIASVLKKAGYRTGLYVSPYIVNFTERMQINGQEIEKEQLARLVGEVKPWVEKMDGLDMPLTEFELNTALAFCWFAKNNCDVVVLEVGLGGRFDATNIIDTPLVSVITGISMDHTQVLGDSLEKIAFEKCGIIKKGGITVTNSAQQEDALAVIMQRVQQERNKLYIGNVNAVKIKNMDIYGSDIQYGELRLHIPLCGKHQIENAVNAVEALRALNYHYMPLSDQDIAEGIACVRMPARIEVICKDPLVILDGAHNVSKMRALANALSQFATEGPINAIIGMLEDKDYTGALSLIAPLCSSIIAVTPSDSRALPAQRLAQVASKHCSDVKVENNLNRALQLASSKEGLVLICGSLYLAGEIRGKALEFFNRKTK